MRINKRWMLVLLVAAGQLALLIPGTLWLASWLNHASRDIVEQRLNAATTRHVLQIADLIKDLDLHDLAEGSEDRSRLKNLISRTGRPYGAFLVVTRSEGGQILAIPENGSGELLLADKSLTPIAVRDLQELGISIRAMPYVADVENLVAQFSDYVRRIILALLIAIVGGSSILTYLIVRRYENRLARINADLEAQVEKRSRELVKSRNAVIFGLAMLAEARDGETGQHLERIRVYVRMLGDELLSSHPEVNEEFVTTIEETSALHDIGKVGVPDSVLLNPDELTAEERKIMMKHPLIGFDTMLAVKRRWGDDQFLITACEICFAHHERFDGKGYPFGLEGDSIPLSARIVALADVYDALTTQRVYKDAMPHEHARQYIVREAGGHFDPVIVEAFISCEAAFRNVVESAEE